MASILDLAEPVTGKPDLLSLAEPISSSEKPVATASGKSKSILDLAEPVTENKSSLLDLSEPAGIRHVTRDQSGEPIDSPEGTGIQVPDYETWKAERAAPTDWPKVLKNAATGVFQGVIKPGFREAGKLVETLSPVGEVSNLIGAQTPGLPTTNQKQALGALEGSLQGVRNDVDLLKQAFPGIADKVTRAVQMAQGYDYNQAAELEKQRKYARFVDEALTQSEREKKPLILAGVGAKSENVDPDAVAAGRVALDPMNFIPFGAPVNRALKAAELSKVPLVAATGSTLARTLGSPTATALEAGAATTRGIGNLAKKIIPLAEKVSASPVSAAIGSGIGAYVGYEHGDLPGAVVGAGLGVHAIPGLSKLPGVAQATSEFLAPLSDVAAGTASAIRGKTGRIAGFGTAAADATSTGGREALGVAGGALPAGEASRRAQILGFGARAARPIAGIVDPVLHGAAIGGAFGAAAGDGDPQSIATGALQGMTFGLLGSGAGSLINSVNKARLGFSPLETANYVRQQLQRLPENQREAILSRLQSDPSKFEQIVPNLEFAEMARGVGGANVDIHFLSDSDYQAAISKMGAGDVKSQGVTVDEASGRPQVLINLDHGDATAHELFHAQEKLLNIVDPTGKVKPAEGLRDAYTAFQSEIQNRFSDSDLVRHYNDYQRKLLGNDSGSVTALTPDQKDLILQELSADTNDRFNKLATETYGIGPDSRRQLARWAAATPLEKIQNTMQLADANRNIKEGTPDSSELFTDGGTGEPLRLTAQEVKNLGNLWTEQGKMVDRLAPGKEALEGGTQILSKDQQAETARQALTSYQEALKGASPDDLTRAEQALNETIAMGTFATRLKDAGTIYKEGQVRAQIKLGRKQVTQAEIEAEVPNVNPLELVDRKNLPLKVNGEPVLTKAKDRKIADESTYNALSEALKPVTKVFGSKEEALKAAKTELVSYPTADGTMVFEGPHLSDAQLDAVMKIPDTVFPAANKVNLEALNGEATIGAPRPVDMTYYGAVKNSGNIPRSRRSIHPNGFYLSKAENFVAKSFDRSSLSHDLEREGSKPAGSSVYLEPFRKPSEPTYANALDRFHETFNRINANHASGVPGAVGLDPDAVKATQLRNAVNGFIGVAPQEINPLASGKNYFKSFRVDRAFNLRAGDELTGKPDYIRAKANFMPDTTPGKLPPAPAEYIGDMDFTDVGGEKHPLFNLTRDVPQNVKGSTVSADSLKEWGFGPPEGYTGQFMPVTQPDGNPNPDFYSSLQKAIEEKMPNKASDKQILGIINGSGVKPEELKWSGLEDWLKTNPNPSKEDVLKYLGDEGSLKFEEVSLDQNGIDARKAIENLSLNMAVGLPAKAMEAGMSQLDAANLPARLADGRIKVSELPTQIQPLAERFLESHAKWMEDNKKPIPPEPKYSQWQLPGGENYREVVLAMPEKDITKIAFPVWLQQSGNADYYQSPPSRQAHIKSEYDALPGRERGIAEDRPGYTSSHFSDIPNYVAHMRLNDRVDSEGKPGTFIEEIQSDRHQEGKKIGYKSDMEAAEKEFGSTENLISARNAVPDAPFRTTWPIQMFKRALRDAVTDGKDWIGWTSGETQADRYDLSKQVDEVHAIKFSDGTYRIDALKKGENTPSFLKSEVRPEELSNLVGKDLAKKIVDNPNQKLNETTTYSGADLKVGGEGMKGFYDQILPSEIGKYVKKWGAKPELSNLNPTKSGQDYYVAPSVTGDGFSIRDAGGNEVKGEFYDTRSQAKDALQKIQGASDENKFWKIPITPKMRESVAQGQPLFMPSTGNIINKVASQLYEKAPQALSELQSLLKELNLPESPMLYQQALDTFDKPEKLRGSGGSEGTKNSVNVFTNQNEEAIKPLQELYAKNIWRLNLLSREAYDKDITTTGLMPTLDFTPITGQHFGVPSADPALEVKQPSQMLGKLEETQMTGGKIPKGTTLAQLGLQNNKLSIEDMPTLDAFFGNGNWVLKEGGNSGAGEGVWFGDKLKADPSLLDHINNLSPRTRASLFVQGAYDVAGSTPEARAAGETVFPGEIRVHITADQDGNAKVIPYGTWVKGEWTPRAIRTPEIRAGEEAALAAVNALPKDQRIGAMFGPDVVKLKDGGYGAVELNPTQLFNSGDAVTAQSSGYLIDNALVQDAYISGLQGKLPIHAKLARLLLAVRGKELAKARGEAAPKAYRNRSIPISTEKSTPKIAMNGVDTASPASEAPL